MCGIIAYVGDKPCAGNILFEGLHTLEYRGYDSSGIALLTENNNIKVFKKKGIVKLAEKKFLKDKLNSKIGIGHTRWATHGEPNNKNSHPILSYSKNFAVVHNGIIENYSSLKQILIEKGYEFKTDTDTEVLINYIEEIYKKSDSNFENALGTALRKIRGAFAIAIINKNNPNYLYGARRGSPLVVGIAEKNFFLASDASPIVKHTNDVIYLKDNEIVKISSENLKITNLKKEKINPEIEKIELKIEEIEKRGFDSFMLKEIMEQPKSIKRSMLGRINIKTKSLFINGINDYVNKLLNAKRIIIVGCGTSWHAGLVAEYFFEKYTRIPVEVEYGSEFRYRDPILSSDDVVFFISQSGETADTLESVKITKKKGATALGIVNSVGSSIARATDEGCYLHAGPEIGVASTKAFTSQLIILFMIGVRLARRLDKIKEKKYVEMIYQLDNIPKLVKEILEQKNTIKNIAKIIYKKQSCLYMARGTNYPVGLEGALKLKEISYIHAEGYPAAELKHGPIALLEKGTPVIVICTRSDEYEKTIANIEEVKARKAMIIAILDSKNKHVSKMVDHSIIIPQIKNDFSPILNIIPLQLLAYYVTKYKGLDVDKPRNLAKSVTVE